MKSKLQKTFLRPLQELIRLPLPFANGGFTLLEILVVVLIIGILGAIALPQYQRAVLKSRFAALMPIAKSMADSNEAFYLEHGIYADNAEELPVQGRRNYSDGTELEFGTLTGYSYVLATRDNDFPNNYVVYQKHSENYPGEIHCEANANDTKAQDVCKSFGPTQELGETLTSGYLTYVLFGTGNGVAPTGNEGGDEPGTGTEPEEPETPTCPDNFVCDGGGNVTGCAAGYVLNGTACITEDNYAKLQTLASTKCPTNYPQLVCTIKNGAVYRCDTTSGTINAQGECVSNGTQIGTYEEVYNPDGTTKQTYSCSDVTYGHCYAGSFKDYAAGTGKSRRCIDGGTLSKTATCANGYDDWGTDETFDSHRNPINGNFCSAVNAQGVCTTYSSMNHYDRTYDGDTQTGYVMSQCASISGTTCVDNNYKNTYADKNNGFFKTYVQCYDSKGGGTNILVSGTCPYGMSIKQQTYQNGKSTYKECTSYESINWANATCS